MKETVNVNISGVVFQIDVDAHEQLKSYLVKIRGYFVSSEERDEIMSDIEARIAELFSSKMTDQNQVISMKDVEEVMELMGRPEQFVPEDDDEDAERTTRNQSKRYQRVNKRLFRDADDRVIGGVASGIAAYLGIDPVWLRLLFIIGFFTGFIGFVFYLILWIIIPEARTASDRLRMKGEPINVENIEKTFKEGATKVNDRVNEMGGNWSERIEHFFSQLFSVVGTLLRGLFKALGKILGFAFFILGIILAITIVGGFFSSNTVYSLGSAGIYSNSINFLDHFFITGEQFQLAKYALGAVLTIPIIALIYGGIRLLFGVKGNTGVGIGLGVIWALALVTCAFIGLQVGSQFSDESKAIDYMSVNSQYRDYVVQLDEKNLPGDDAIHITNEEFLFTWDKSTFYYGYPDFKIEMGMGDSIVLEVHKSSYGKSMKQSLENARSIEYSFVQNENLISLSPFISYAQSNKIRGQEASLVLKLPIGKVVYLDPSMEPLIFDIDNVTGTWDKDMLGKRWVMLEDGLTCLDCAEIEGIKSDELKEITIEMHIEEEIEIDESSSDISGTFRFPQLITYFVSSFH